MPNKTEEYLALACKMADSFSRQWEHWAEFLITAARLYKYSYPDQLMIYAKDRMLRPVPSMMYSSMTTTQKTYLHIIQELENQDIDLVMRSLSGLS